VALAPAIGDAREIGGAEQIGGAPNPIHAPDVLVVALLAGLELLAILLVVSLWRERGRSRASRLFWTAMTLVPVIGLIAWVVWRDPPPPNDPTDRPPERLEV
jgi:hypothetical protein